MTAAPATSGPAAAKSGAGPIKVMIVDDSAVIRGLLTRALEFDSDIKVVASVSNGEQAIGSVQRHDVDVIVLDIEMPVMDGLTALPKLIAAAPGVKVIMASTLTRRNAEISLKCLAAGADDYVSKPTSTREINAAEDFKRDLVDKVRALGEAKRGGASSASATSAEKVASPAPVTLADKRTTAQLTPLAIAIGSSTGGPQALFTLMAAMAPTVNVPIFVTQHMPPTFTTILAEHIGQASGRPSGEANNGETVLDGHVYVAPGDYHMTVRSADGKKIIGLNQDPPQNFCRPAVDTMLHSMVRIYGSRLLTVILTGMGHDGLAGSKAVTEAGGTVLAQDEASSVVWGMPGAVADAGICTAVLPLSQLGARISRIAAGQDQ